MKFFLVTLHFILKINHAILEWLEAFCKFPLESINHETLYHQWFQANFDVSFFAGTAFGTMLSNSAK